MKSIRLHPDYEKMNAAQRARALRNVLAKKGYPFLGTEVLLEVDNRRAFPLVQLWDDSVELLRVIAFCDRDNQLASLGYARAMADQDEFGDLTACYAIGRGAYLTEQDAESIGDVIFFLGRD